MLALLRSTARGAALALALSLAGWCAHASRTPSDDARAPRERPNIVVVIADDLGYGDLGCYGHAIATPALDGLAARGLRFTDFHTSAPVCSPTRAGFLTGRYQQRSGIDHVLAIESDVGRRQGLFEQEVTLPELLRAEGYATALIGKWHLGYEDRFAPSVHGFESFFGFRGGNIDYHNQRDMRGHVDVWENDERATVEGYTTHWITARAVAAIERQHATRPGQPFFLVVAHAAVHKPLQGPDDPPLRRYGAPWKFPPEHDDAHAYRAMIRELDAGVGALTDCLQRLDLAEDTLFLFFSDNGGLEDASNGELRGHKGHLHEGGHRVPAIVVWPGQVKPGTTDAFVTSLDWMPTLLALAGATPPPDPPLDGRDVGAHLLAGRELEPRRFFWSHHNQFAVRVGTTKLFGVLSQDRTQQRFELYDLARDPGEARDLSARAPERVAALHRAFRAWQREVLDGATPQPGR